MIKPSWRIKHWNSIRLTCWIVCTHDGVVSIPLLFTTNNTQTHISVRFRIDEANSSTTTDYESVSYLSLTLIDFHCSEHRNINHKLELITCNFWWTTSTWSLHRPTQLNKHVASALVNVVQMFRSVWMTSMFALCVQNDEICV